MIGDHATNAPIIAIYFILYVQVFFFHSFWLSSVHPPPHWCGTWVALLHCGSSCNISFPINACQRSTCNSLSFVQIDYSLPRPSQREGTFHIMPLLGYITLATINFLDVIGASPSHLTWFQEDEAEFSRYELPHQLKDVPHWVGKEGSL